MKTYLDCIPCFYQQALRAARISGANEEVQREANILTEGHIFKVYFPETVHVPGDYELLKQMVLNVIDNAFKFTPSGGSIELALTASADYASIEVTDNGIGISAENLPHVTEPFYKIATPRVSSRGGTGLGLSIVKQVIDIHKGKLEIDSQVGRGTKIKILLPLAFSFQKTLSRR